MRRRKTGRDGFQGYSPTAAAAWERIFGAQDSDPAPTQESPAEKSHKALTDFYKEPNAAGGAAYYRDPAERPCDLGKACHCTGDCQ